MKMAMEAGKHVLVEKPVGSTVEEITEMMAIAAANKVNSSATCSPDAFPEHANSEVWNLLVSWVL